METIEGLKDDEIIQGLLQIGKHARIAAHIPGRIRLKISMDGVKALNDGNGGHYENIRIPGICNFRVNAFARSIIIEYDRGKIPFDLWERLGRVKENSASVAGRSLIILFTLGRVRMKVFIGPQDRKGIIHLKDNLQSFYKERPLLIGHCDIVVTNFWSKRGFSGEKRTRDKGCKKRKS